jgi:hypothetical protein
MDIFKQLKADFESLERRVDTAFEIGFTGMKGLTWDLFTLNKTPAQVGRDIKAIAEDFERKEREYRRRQSQ